MYKTPAHVAGRFVGYALAALLIALFVGLVFTPLILLAILLDSVIYNVGLLAVYIACIASILRYSYKKRVKK